MVEIPIWMLALFTFAIYVLFMMLLDANRKINNINLQTVINSQVVSKSFEEIAIDMDGIYKTVTKLDAEYEYTKNKIS
jgi:hypothetical protein